MTNARTDESPERGGARAQPGGASIRWRVGSGAARSVFGGVGGEVFIEFRLIETGRGSWRGEVLLDAGAEEPSRLREFAPRVRWTRDTGRGLVHIDAEGFVHATIDVSNGAPSLVYARTGLLGELGLPGGRYELAGVEIGRDGITSSARRA